MYYFLEKTGNLGDLLKLRNLILNIEQENRHPRFFQIQSNNFEEAELIAEFYNTNRKENLTLLGFVETPKGSVYLAHSKDIVGVSTIKLNKLDPSINLVSDVDSFIGKNVFFVNEEKLTIINN